MWSWTLEYEGLHTICFMCGTNVLQEGNWAYMKAG